MSTRPAPLLRRSWLNADTLAAPGLFILALLFFREQIFGGYTWFHEDLSDAYYPMHEYIKQELAQGTLPLWDPYRFGGQPFISNIGTALLYPLTWLSLVMSVERYLVWMLLFQYWLAAYGTYAYCRRMRLSVGAALLGAIGFGFGSLMVVHLNHPVTLGVVSLLPWALLATEAGSIAGTTLVFAVQLFSSSPQIFVICLVVWFALSAATRGNAGLRGLVILTCVSVPLAGTLAAVQYVPFYEVIRRCVAPVHAVKGIWGTLQISEIPNFFLPELHPSQRQYSFPTVLLSLSLLTWLPVKAPSPAPLDLKRVRITLWLTVIGSFVVAVVASILATHSTLFRFPVRWTNIALFSIPLLAAIGYDRLSALSQKLAYAAWILGVASVWWLGRSVYPADDLAAVAPPPLLTTLAQNMDALDRFIVLPDQDARHYIDSGVLNWPLVTRQFSACGYDALVDIDYLQFLSFAANRRPLTAGETYFLSVTHNIPIWPTLDARYLALLHVTRAVRSSPTGVTIENVPLGLPRWFLCDRFTVERDRDKTLAAIGATRDPSTRVYLDRPPAWPTVGEEGAKTAGITLESFTPNRIRLSVTAPRNTILVLSENYAPEWVCTVDGQPAEIARAFWVLRAVAVPAGSHEVVMEYRPDLLRGAIISLLGCMLWTIILYLERRRSGPRGTGAPPLTSTGGTDDSANQPR